MTTPDEAKAKLAEVRAKVSAAAESARNRLQLDLADSVSLLLDHASGILGVPKSQLVLQALLQALPGLVEQADQVRKRSRELTQATQGKR